MGCGGLYQFSGLFEKTVRDIRSWTMSSEFFDVFPDMYDDIMPFDTPLYRDLLSGTQSLAVLPRRKQNGQELQGSDVTRHETESHRNCEVSRAYYMTGDVVHASCREGHSVCARGYLQ
jgi:hypothetical protein